MKFDIEELRAIWKNKTIKGGLMIICKNKILLVKQQPGYDCPGGNWGIVKGHSEDYDKTIIDTALRECCEEVGFLPPVGSILSEMTHIVVGNCILFCAICALDIFPTITIKTSEISNYEWVTFEQAKRKQCGYPSRELINQLPKIIRNTAVLKNYLYI